MSYWYQLDASEILEQLSTDRSHGLKSTEANCRLKKGANELIEHPSKSIWMIIWEQFTSSTMLLLIAAAGISMGLGDYQDTIAILAIVLITVLIG
jgi:P-type Ca2+ transporter type 2C